MGGIDVAARGGGKLAEGDATLGNCCVAVVLGRCGGGSGGEYDAVVRAWVAECSGTGGGVGEIYIEVVSSRPVIHAAP